MAVRREVVSLSQLLQRRNSGTSSTDRRATPIARPETPLVSRVSAGALAPDRSYPVTRPPPIRNVASRPPVQRVRSSYEAQSQHEVGYQSQSAHSVYSLSQEEDSCMSLSQPQHSQSQLYVTPSQEETRGHHVRAATPTVQQSRYFHLLRESGKMPHKLPERAELPDETIEKLLNPLKKGLDDISVALERQQDDHGRHKSATNEVKERIEGLASSVEKLWKQHRERDDCAAASARDTNKMASALDDIQYSLKKMQDRMEAFTDFATRFSEQERTINRALLAAMAGVYPTGESPSRLHTVSKCKRKPAASPGTVRVHRKRSRSYLPIGSPDQDSSASTPERSDMIWVGSDHGNAASNPREANSKDLRSALKKLQDVRTRHQRR